MSPVLIVFVLGFISAVLSQTPAPGYAPNPEPVPSYCLRCLCDAQTGCDPSPKCTGDVCGLFKITWGFWHDAGRLTANNESPQSDSAYVNCTTDIDCATRTTSSYLKRFEQDCNQDGKIDCYDYAAIHVFGGYGCQQYLPAAFKLKFDKCLGQASNSVQF